MTEKKETGAAGVRGKQGRGVRGNLRCALLACLVALCLCAPAFATEGGSGSSAGDLSSVVSSMDTLTSIVSKIFSMLTGNPLLVLFLAAGLLSVGIGVFKKLKRAAR